ncbi:MAG: two-component system, NtrC family, nitrogen regulation sensor histidine kinase NtrY, partial [Sphingomonadales bacterium]|nr:two-component system, NtrC family, nitrogen regulation sensor histidine kinase NtrY [Sphingomonadales bacterium]
MSVAIHRSRFVPLLELLTLLALIAIAGASYYIIRGQGSPGSPLSPPTVAGMLVANLVPAMALMVLIARRVAMRRAARSPAGGRGRLHVRLVALFSAIASVPTLLVVIFASVLFQNGMQFWFSERAKTVLTSAENVSQIYEREHVRRIRVDVEVMGADLVQRINWYGLDSGRFYNELLNQIAGRQLKEAAVLTLDPRGRLHQRVKWNPDRRPLGAQLDPKMLVAMSAGQVHVFQSSRDRIEAVVRLDPQAAIYAYGSRDVAPEAITALANARNAASDYQKTLNRARTFQFRFNAALLVVSLLIVGIAIWIALTLADRLVRPLGQLVDAAKSVGAGNLTARVPASPTRDEIGTLGTAFNRMTRRLEEQTGALVSANSQL